MTKDMKYNDPALREALRQEQAAIPHFQLADSWQDAVMKQTNSKSLRIIWTAAAAFVVLLIGATTILWQQKADDSNEDLKVNHQEVRAPKVGTPVAITQIVPAQAELSSAAQTPKLVRKMRHRISQLPKQESDETAETPEPTSLSANRDRMRQAMFEKMNRHSDMTDFEPEIIDEI